MCGIDETGKMEWVTWRVRSCPETGKAFVEAVNQTGRRDAHIAFTAPELESFVAAASKALQSLTAPA